MSAFCLQFCRSGMCWGVSGDFGSLSCSYSGWQYRYGSFVWNMATIMLLLTVMHSQALWEPNYCSSGWCSSLNTYFADAFRDSALRFMTTPAEMILEGSLLVHIFCLFVFVNIRWHAGWNKTLALSSINIEAGFSCRYFGDAEIASLKPGPLVLRGGWLWMNYK